MRPGPLLFNPARTSIEELEATFVARRPLLENLEGNLISDSHKRTRRHWQLIGPRGSGKSHLTELVAHHLVRDHGWAVARLPEEHYQISSVGELLDQILIRLEQTSVSPLADVADLRDLEELALDRIRLWREHHGKPILVILENLGTLFERKLRDRRSQSRLREILTRDPPFILLATSTSHVDATIRHDAPFYDFFQSITLEELSPDEVVALVEARARWDMDELRSTRLEVVRARAHAAFHFSGGNPRLVLALCAFLRRSPTDELYPHVLRLLDEVTPYYQQRLGDLSSQMGRILAEMAISGSALTPSEIARRCRMPINHVTANIAKLVAERFVRPVGRPDKRRRNYDLNDRLFRIWMQMREGHSARQRLRLLSEFFQRWYEGHPDEVRRAGADLAEASWHDPPGTTAQRCREHLATPEDLQGAMPEHVELLLANSLYDHRRPARSEVAEDQVRRLRALSRSGNRALKAIAGIFLAIALEYLDLPQEALQVLRDADARELPPELRHAVLRSRLGMVARVSGPATAIAEGRELIEREPELADLRAVLAAISVDAGDLPGARKLVEDLLMTEPCIRCVSVTIDQLVRAIVLGGQIDHLSSMLDLYEAHVAPAEILLRALKALGTPQPARSKPERFLQAVAHWPSLAEVPGWLLWAAACTVSHTPGYALDTFPLTRSLVDRGSRVDLHTAHHVLLALLEAAARDAPAFEAMVDWTATHVPGDVLSAAFVEWMPAIARAKERDPASILRVYAALRQRSALPSDLPPYSAAVQVREDPASMASLSPEVREAVTLLLGTDEPKSAHDRPLARRGRAAPSTA